MFFNFEIAYKCSVYGNNSKSYIKFYIKYKKKTVKRKIASVKAYYNYLEEYEIIDDNPFRKIKVKFKETTVLPKIIPREEIEILLNYIHSCKRINNEKAYKYWLRDIVSRSIGCC